MKKVKKSKARKEKKVEQNENGLGKKQWGPVKTVATVFSSVALVCGTTVLGVYLAGGFEEKVVNPESIAFSYDATLFNESYNQLETTNEFTLTITTPTEGVTKNKVTLSFDGSLPVTSQEGFISNTIISVPEYVTIGQPFTVSLMTDVLKDEDGKEIVDEFGNKIDWINGGLSTLIAKSEYNQISQTLLNIAVDTPVYKTETILTNSKNEQTNKIVTNEIFSSSTKFIPAKSEYMFGDDKNTNIEESLKRKKKSFFRTTNVSASNVNPIYDSKESVHFVAGLENVDNATIIGYTFKNANDQLLKEQEFADFNDETYYGSMISYLATSSQNSVLSQIDFSIGQASIGNFTVSKHSQTLTMTTSETTRLFLNKQNDNNFLGVNIYSSSGQLLDGVLGNIALSFRYLSSDPTLGDNAFLFVSGGETVEIDGITYYKPNIENVTDKRYGFWDISATDNKGVDIIVSLLVEGENGTTVFELNGEDLTYLVSLNITKHEEGSLAWNNQADIDVMLEYDEDGQIKPQSISLDRFKSVPETNIYQDAVFFAYFGDGDKQTLYQTAIATLGQTGIDYERSGFYSTNSGNLMLFVLTGDSFSLYNSGSFKLYYGTKITKDGQDVIAPNGLYNMALMCDGFVNVKCQKVLYTTSVTSGTLNSENFTANDNNIISIPQGTTKTFNVSFNVSKSSYPVFEEEYNKGLMSLKIEDNLHNDITSNFIVDASRLVLNNETGEGTMQYTLKVNEATQISNENGIFIGFVSLNYASTSQNNLSWTFPVATDASVCIYKPIAKQISIEKDEDYLYDDVLSGDITILANQTLQSDGSFKVQISFDLGGETKTFATIEELLNELFGQNLQMIKVCDQMGDYETLAENWTFAVKEGDSSVLNFVSEGKSFTFKNANNKDVKIYIQSTDKESSTIDDMVLSLKITSTGITSLKFDASQNTYNQALTEQEDVSKAVVSKYGAMYSNDNETINLYSGEGNKDILQFFVGETRYASESLKYKLSTQYISGSSLTDEMIVDLFGSEGMITLYGEDGNVITFSGDESATNIKTTLLSSVITKLKINKNFATSHTIKFQVSDETGAVNTSLDLVIMPNISVTSESYPANGANIYAGELDENATAITNTYSYRNSGSDRTGNISELFNGKYYIVLSSEQYVLIPEDDYTDENSDYEDYIAVYENGKITFKDFWDEEQKSYTIMFRPEGNNYFALNKAITFTVNRDLVIKVNEEKNRGYYVLSINTFKLDNFVTFSRHNVEEAPNGFTYSTSFSDYLTFNSGGNIVKKNGADFFFDYNVQSLSTNLVIKLNEEDSDEDALKIINVPIKLYSTGKTLYQTLAESLVMHSDSGSTQVTAQSQIIGDTNYVMLDTSESNSWMFNQLGQYYIAPSQRDYNNNKVTAYTVISMDKPINISSQNSIIAGINNSTYYISLKFLASKNSTEVLAYVNVPLVISKAGFDIVHYDSVEIGANGYNEHSLEYALMTPERLYENDIYNTLTAGQISKIISQIKVTKTEAENIVLNSQTNGGLYTLENLSPMLENYSLDSQTIKTSNDILKQINISKDENQITSGMITLNHCSTSVEDLFLALRYTLSTQSGSKQEFFYLVKIVPDVVTEESIYAYDGTSEHISGVANSENMIDLGEIYGSTTLHEGYSRFNISKIVKASETTITDDEGNEKSVLNSFSIIANTNSKVKFAYNKAGEKVEKIITVTASDKQVGYDISTIFDNKSDNDSIVAGTEIYVTILSGDAIVYYNNVEAIRTLKTANQVLSVKTADGRTYYSSDEWSKYIALNFVGNQLYFTPKNSTKFEIEFKHSYVGSVSDDDLLVVGGDQTYNLVINESAVNYSVRVTNNDNYDITQQSNKIVWNINNYDANNEGSKIKTINLNLIENAQAGSSTSGTVVYNKMNVKLTSGIKNNDFADEHYNTADGKFTFTLKDYISSNRTVKFALYTDYGFLTTLEINLSANISFENKQTEIIGGNSYSAGDLVTFKEGTNTPSGSFAVSEIEIIDGNTEFVKIESNKIIVSDLLADKQVSFKITVNFGENRDFTFTITRILKANVFTNSVVSGSNTIAGEEEIVDVTKFYQDLCSPSENVSVEYTAQSSSPAFKGYDSTTRKISTDYVSENVTVDVVFTVTINFEKDNSNVTQSFDVTYSFNVYKSVEFKTNYPIPSGTKQLEKEYLSSGDIFESVTEKFLFQNASFSNSNRLIVKGAQKDDSGEISYEITTADINKDFSVIITSLKNATIKLGDESLRENESINLTKTGLTFNRGKDGVDNGGDSIVEFTITYQKVSTTYTVFILTNAYSVSINSVSNNVSSGVYSYTNEQGDNENSTVSYETIYVDKTNTSNLFAPSRMMKATVNADVSAYLGTYYMVFKEVNTVEIDGQTTNVTNYYQSYSLYVSKDDQGKSLTYDLGVSMAGKTIEGLYRTSDFEKYMFKTTDSSNQLENFDASKLTSYLDDVFEVGSVSLASRAELVYGGIVVDYAKYGDNINKLSISGGEGEGMQTIDIIYSHDPLLSFDKNDGSKDSVKNFSVKYYYKPSIDIEVENKTTEGGKYTSIIVNKEYSSVAELYGIIHPTNNQYLTYSDFISSNTTLNIEVVEELDSTAGNTEEEKNIFEIYKSLYGVGKFTNIKGSNEYLRYRANINSYNNTYDFNLLAQGAKNEGDYVLTKITYANAGFTKSFYVVVKIMPDYVVTFGGSASSGSNQVTSDGTTVISNYDNPYTITTTSDTYSFNLTGENGYLSIKHSEGSNTNNELSGIFKTTLSVDQIIESITYNNSINVQNKLNNHSDINLSSFSGIPAVKFADQYYFIDGEDEFGYKFRLFFVLKSTNNNPVPTESLISLTECDYFDVTSAYQLLSISADSDNSSNNIYISSAPAHALSSDSTKLIEIQGISSWGFGKDYTEGNEVFLTKADTGSGYKVKDGYTLINGEEYLNSSKMMLPNVMITNIDLYSEDNNHLASILKNGTRRLATKEYNTSDFVFNGLDNTSPPSSREVSKRPDNKDANQNNLSLQIPRIINTDIYGNGSVAQVKMVVTLSYNGEEYFDCVVPVQISREIAITSANSVAIDAKDVTLDGIIEVKTIEKNKTVKTTFINDTLDILINANDTARFEMTLNRDNKDIAQTSVAVSNTGYAFEKTYYLSLSTYFGTNIKEGDKITFKDVSGVSKLYYRSDNNTTDYYQVIYSRETNANHDTMLTVSLITKDCMYLDDARMLSNGYYSTTRYYITNVTLSDDSTDTGATSSQSYAYRVSKPYTLTPTYFSLKKQGTTEIADVLNWVKDSTNIAEDNKTGLNAWLVGSSGAGQLYNAMINNGAVTEQSAITELESEYLKIELDKNEGTTNNVTINSDGSITLPSDFDDAQYIKVNIYVLVSGQDRNFNEGHDSNYYYFLGSLKLGKKKSSSN